MDMGSRKMENSDKLIWELALRRLEKGGTDAEWTKKLFFAGIRDDTAVFLCSRGNEENGHKETLEEALSWAAGRKINAELRSQKVPLPESIREERKKGTSRPPVAGVLAFLVLILAAALLAGNIFLRSTNPEKSFYGVTSAKINGNVRLVQLSDLGNTSFGEGNRGLLESVSLLEPDLIVMTGNIAGADKENAFSLCQELSEIAEIVYAFGENEENLGADYESELETEGIHVLRNEAVSITAEGNTIDLYGVFSQEISADDVHVQDTFREFYEGSPKNFKIMVSNDPYLYSGTSFKDWPDLLLSGGTLGGGINLPYFGVLHDPVYGFLPERKMDAYVSGKYYIGTSMLIVSRGLTNEGVFRIGNPPEITVIDLSRY